MGKAKLERALKRGGMAERRTDEGYHVWRCRNRKRRALGVLPLNAGDDLRADGKICLLPGESELYSWAATVQREAMPARPQIAAQNTPRKAPRNFLSCAFDCASDERERFRLIDAAQQLSVDFESASNGESLTMNWTKFAHGRVDGGAGTRGAPRSYASARSSRRLHRVADMLGDDAWKILFWTFVCELSGRDIAARLCLSSAASAAKLADILRAVADVYDQKVRRLV